MCEREGRDPIHHTLSHRQTTSTHLSASAGHGQRPAASASRIKTNTRASEGPSAASPSPSPLFSSVTGAASAHSARSSIYEKGRAHHFHCVGWDGRGGGLLRIARGQTMIDRGQGLFVTATGAKLRAWLARTCASMSRKWWRRRHGRPGQARRKESCACCFAVSSWRVRGGWVDVWRDVSWWGLKILSWCAYVIVHTTAHSRTHRHNTHSNVLRHPHNSPLFLKNNRDRAREGGVDHA